MLRKDDNSQHLLFAPDKGRVFALICNFGQVTELELSGCCLTRLSLVLPPLLENLQCQNNLLTSLPKLPPTLRKLYCDNNKLNTLPKLAHTKITFLSCSHNELVCIPTLPQTLAVFCCDNNCLPRLPDLPRELSILVCNNNVLKSLPPLGPMLSRIIADNNYLTKLPGLPSNESSFAKYTFEYNPLRYGTWNAREIRILQIRENVVISMLAPLFAIAAKNDDFDSCAIIDAIISL
jgi:Leucine-rich repeat (LRR) protein